jgi:hypothetical protein
MNSALLAGLTRVAALAMTADGNCAETYPARAIRRLRENEAMLARLGGPAEKVIRTRLGSVRLLGKHLDLPDFPNRDSLGRRRVCN